MLVQVLIAKYHLRATSAPFAGIFGLYLSDICDSARKLSRKSKVHINQGNCAKPLYFSYLINRCQKSKRAAPSSYTADLFTSLV
jgi:hypothetical protein